MMRPGSAIKRKIKAPPQKQAQQQKALDKEQLEASSYIKKRDWAAALTLLECDKKYSQRHDFKTYLSIAYCAFHAGDYKKALDTYDELTKREGYD